MGSEEFALRNSTPGTSRSGSGQPDSAAATRDPSLITQPSPHGLRKYIRELQKKKGESRQTKEPGVGERTDRNSPERGSAGRGEATAIERACSAGRRRLESRCRGGGETCRGPKPTRFIRPCCDLLVKNFKRNLAIYEC